MRKTVLVMEAGAIQELGNVAGPITTATRIDVKNIAKLVKNGKEVII